LLEVAGGEIQPDAKAADYLRCRRRRYLLAPLADLDDQLDLVVDVG